MVPRNNTIDGVLVMDEFGCDYACGTVGESIEKYNIPDDWWAEFDVCDYVCPIIVIQVDKIRKAPAMMDLELRIIEHPDDEYAGCMVFTDDVKNARNRSRFRAFQCVKKVRAIPRK